MPENWSNHSKGNHSINMSIFYWNHIKHCVKYVKTRVFSDPYLSVYGENLQFCPYTGKYGFDFNTDGKIKIILLKFTRRSVLRLTLCSLKLCRILEALSRKVTTSGVPLIVVTTIWSFSPLSKCFFSHGSSNVDARSEVSSALSVAYLGPIKHLRCSFLRKILKPLKTFYKKILKPLNILVKGTILYVWWSPKCLIETSYKLGLMLCQTIIHTNFENICILWCTPSIMY